MMKQVKVVGLIVVLCSVLVGWRLLESPVIADNLRFDEQELTVRAIAKVMPSVVSINVYADEELLLDINGHLNKQITKVYKGAGTGLIVSGDGLIVTNRHVVADEGTNVQYQVARSNGNKQNAKLIGVDPLNDLAILKIDGQGLPAAELGSSKQLPLGATVIAVGNVLGKYPNSVSKGIVSGKGRSLSALSDDRLLEDLDNVLQTDANISVGHSGGPLIDLNGKVVGINVATDKAGSAVGFAIPIDDAKPIIDSVKKFGRIIRTRLGLRYISLNPENAIKLQAMRDRGAYVVKSQDGVVAITPDSPAQRAGIQEGDIITEVNGQIVGDDNSLSSLVQGYQPGDKIKLRVVRGLQTIFTEVTLDEFLSK